METMTATYHHHSPPKHSHQQNSLMREPLHKPSATRTTHPAAHDADLQHQQHHHHPQHHSNHQTLSTPASQESFVSVQSAGSSIAPPLQGSDSNLSQITTHTDYTSPSSSAGSKPSQDAPASASTKTQARRDTTPENRIGTAHLNGDNALASPMSITSPVATNGAKRTASGHVKNAASLSNTPYSSMFPGRESRRDSLSSSGSKAGELAATLKTRLGYAMAKVQHGWEHKSLHEVEQLAAHRARSNRNSMSHIDSRPSTSGLSHGTAGLSFYDNTNRATLQPNGQPPSKRHSGTYSSYVYPAYQSGPTPYLQPAPDIRPGSGSRPYAAQQQYATHVNGSAMSPPRTPVNTTPRRPPTIRTETQTLEAERDALQALFQLGSPHTSQIPRSATGSSSQMSPMKTDLDTPRRVTFARSESDSSGGGPPSSGGSDARRGS